MSPNPTKNDPAGRGDLPSGRQASEQPEHTGKENISPDALHQGQGPDFQTQDENMKHKNGGVQQIVQKNQASKAKRANNRNPDLKGGFEDES